MKTTVSTFTLAAEYLENTYKKKKNTAGETSLKLPVNLAVNFLQNFQNKYFFKIYLAYTNLLADFLLIFLFFHFISLGFLLVIYDKEKKKSKRFPMFCSPTEFLSLSASFKYS